MVQIAVADHVDRRVGLAEEENFVLWIALVLIVLILLIALRALPKIHRVN